MSNQPLPAIGTMVMFIADDDLPFTGIVVKSYGFAVSVADRPGAELPIAVLNAGTPYTVVGSD